MMSSAWGGRAVPLARPINQQRTSVIALPYPYELGWNRSLGKWTYKVTKVDPGGTAQIVEVGPGSEIQLRRRSSRAFT